MLMVILCGIPLFYMEVMIGQFSGTGCTGMFRLVPLLKGTGICMVIVNLYCVCYYSVIISYPVRMLYYCFWKTVPWIDCHHPWNSPNCTTVDNVSESIPQPNTTTYELLNSSFCSPFSCNMLKVAPPHRQMSSFSRLSCVHR